LNDSLFANESPRELRGSLLQIWR